MLSSELDVDEELEVAEEGIVTNLPPSCSVTDDAEGMLQKLSVIKGSVAFYSSQAITDHTLLTAQQQLELKEAVELIRLLVGHSDEIRQLIQQREWVLNGMLLHALPETALQAVADKQARIGKTPTHYFYPELYMRDNMPEDLAAALANKRN